MLSKEQILNARDREIVKVEVPEWGGSIYLKSLSGSDRDEFESISVQANEKKNWKNIRAQLLVYTITDESGNKLFEKKDIEKLGAKSGKVLDRLFVESQKLSKIRNEDIEGLEKN